VANTRKPNPMAKDLRQPKYKPRVIPNKKKTIPRKVKNNGTTTNQD